MRQQYLFHRQSHKLLMKNVLSVLPNHRREIDHSFYLEYHHLKISAASMRIFHGISDVVLIWRVDKMMRYFLAYEFGKFKFNLLPKTQQFDNLPIFDIQKRPTTQC